MRHAAATAFATSLLLALLGIAVAVSDHAQRSARLDQRLALQADGAAGAVDGLFARTRLALRLLSTDPAFREGLAIGGNEASRGMQRALRSLERAEPAVTGASAIALDGRERARVVRGAATPVEALGADLRAQPFFRAVLGTRPGDVAVSRPYRSPDTGALVVASTALVHDGSGALLGMVRLELALASVRRAVEGALGGGLGEREVALIDGTSGGEVVHTGGGERSEARARIAQAGESHGILSLGGRRVAYRSPAGAPAGARWIVIAEGAPPSLLTTAGIPFALGSALAAAGGMLLRHRKRREAERLRAAERARAESGRSALTGLPDRRRVLAAIAAELARSDRTGVPPSVLLLDLDHFRRVGDVYGRDVGERVLDEVASRLQGRLRGYDVLGRLRGEQFIVLAPAVPDDETLRRLADQIRRLVGTLPFALPGGSLLPITVSIGAVRAGEALRSAEGLIDCAGRALEAARRRGGDRVQLFGDLTVEDLVAEDPEPLRLARALALSTSARGDLPHADAERISDLAAAIAAQLGLGEEIAMRCRLGGLLHDIGTAAISDRILALVGPPLARDRLAYEGHASAGARLVRGVAGVSDVAPVVESHEEWFDGTGYPAGLSEGEIPLESRIVACAAAYVALAALVGETEAARGLQRQAGSALDPEVVIAALALLTQDPRHPARRRRDVRTT